ncbi:MAG: hypothetical protein Q4F72_01075 [Desulfovibrionaceae bacterium]|nr:hypothetical protein [Desulfovibrionaceae bacterium]
MSIQSARSRKSGSEETRLPMPEKPEEVRYSIACLYGAAFISICFLIMNGDVQWYEDKSNSFSMMRVALLHMGVSAVVDAGTAFALSRFLSWARPVLMVCTGIGLIFHIMTFGSLVVLSPGFLISRMLTLFMELGAVFLLLRGASRNWFASLAERSALMRRAGQAD